MLTAQPPHGKSGPTLGLGAQYGLLGPRPCVVQRRLSAQMGAVPDGAGREAISDVLHRGEVLDAHSGHWPWVPPASPPPVCPATHVTHWSSRAPPARPASGRTRPRRSCPRHPGPPSSFPVLLRGATCSWASCGVIPQAGATLRSPPAPASACRGARPGSGPRTSQGFRASVLH